MRWFLGLFACGLLLSTTATSAVAQSREIREGTVAMGGGGGYGLITGEARYGLDFDSGPGYNVMLKYSVSRHVALGFNFQNQSYQWVDGEPQYDDLVLTTFEGHVYFYRSRDADANQYAVLGLGIFRPELRRNVGETVFPGEGLILTAGLGTELFLRENWAIDLSGRALGYFSEGIADPELDIIESSGSVSFGLTGQIGILYYLIK